MQNLIFFKNNINQKYPRGKQKGQVMLLVVIIFLFISLSVVSGLVAPTVREFKISSDSVFSKQSIFLSESGVEDAFYRFKTNKPIGSSVSITLNGNTANTTIVDTGGQKTISAVGDVLNRERANELVLTAGTGVSFSYGVQTGVGGLVMGNNSSIQGSVYSNGNITGSGSITGTALSANSEALTADQVNGSGTPAYDVTFGAANNRQDFAQSFQISTTSVVNKVELYLRKISTPNNLTIRIVTDASGSPSTTTLASGALSASLVSTTYGWVSVPFSTNPELTAGVTYWIVIDGSTSATKYYQIGANSAGYASGTGKIGPYAGTWSNTTPAGLDGFFKLYLGGLTGLISGITVGTGGVGNAYAHTINSSSVAGTKYCQVTNNSPACNTSLADPAQIAMPISDQNILDWKDEAEAGGVYNGNYTVNGTTNSLGPKKINGNLTVSNNGKLTITGTLWVTGNIDISNNANVSLASSYGANEGLIVADGTVNIGNNAVFAGSGTSGSYLMMLSTSTSTSAITLSNNGGAVILYAAYGTVNLSNNASAKSLNGKYINLSNNTVIIYDSGLANANFVSGPSGGWNVTSWKEVQ